MSKLVLKVFMLALSLLLWLLSWHANAWAFSFAEVDPGVSLLFLPHGMRVLLSLLFGFWGASGIAMASFLFHRNLWSDDPWASMITPLISGYCAWFAMKISLGLGNHSGDRRLEKLDSRSLIGLICLSALINSLGHTLIFVDARDASCRSTWPC
ncbi:MAG: hypothetical protein ACO3V7_09240 [Burkholderiaceae bacterium]